MLETGVDTIHFAISSATLIALIIGIFKVGKWTESVKLTISYIRKRIYKISNDHEIIKTHLNSQDIDMAVIKEKIETLNSRQGDLEIMVQDVIQNPGGIK